MWTSVGFGIFLSFMFIPCKSSEQTQVNLTIDIFIRRTSNDSGKLDELINRMNWKYTKGLAEIRKEEANDDFLIHAIQQYVNTSVPRKSNELKFHVTSTDCNTDQLLTSLSSGPRISVTPNNCDVSASRLRAPALHVNPGSYLPFLALQDILDREPISLADFLVLFHDTSVVSDSVSTFSEWLGRRKPTKSLAIYGLSGRSSGTETAHGEIKKQIRYIADYMSNADLNIYAYVMVMYTEENIKILLNWVSKYKMNSKRFMWLVLGGDLQPSNFDLLGWDKNNLVFLTADLSISLHTREDCNFNQKLLRDARSEGLENEDFYLLEAITIAFEMWTMLNTTCEHNISKDVRTAFRKNTFNGFLHGVKYGQYGYNSMSIFELYRTSREESRPRIINLENIGTWSQRAGLNVSGGSIFKNRFKDFQHGTLNISMIEVHPFVIKKINYSAEDNITYEGFCIDLLEEMKTSLNFRYRIVTPDPPVVGVPQGDNTWSGEIGLIMKQKANMIAGPITITMERSAVVDFTTVFMEGDNSIIMKKPEGYASPLEKIFEPFHFMVWIYAICLTVGFALALITINWFLPPELPVNSAFNRQYNTKKITAAESVWLVFTNSMDQSGSEYPTTNSARTLVVILWLFSILLSAYYTANLAATLTAPTPTPHIESITELSEQTTIKPLIKNSTALTQLFNDSKPPSVYATIWQELQQSIPFPKDNTEALKMVKKTGDYGFMGDTPQLKFVMQKECNTYVLATESFFKGGLAFVVPKDAEYRDAISTTISKMQEAGLIERLRQKWWPHDACTEDTDPSKYSLRFPALSGAFFICGVFSAGSILVFLVEYMCSLRSCTGRGQSQSNGNVTELNLERNNVSSEETRDEVIEAEEVVVSSKL